MLVGEVCECAKVNGEPPHDNREILCVRRRLRGRCRMDATPASATALPTIGGRSCRFRDCKLRLRRRAAATSLYSPARRSSETAALRAAKSPPHARRAPATKRHRPPIHVLRRWCRGSRGCKNARNVSWRQRLSAGAGVRRTQAKDEPGHRYLRPSSASYRRVTVMRYAARAKNVCRVFAKVARHQPGVVLVATDNPPSASLRRGAGHRP